jgi:hypothetical protein
MRAQLLPFVCGCPVAPPFEMTIFSLIGLGTLVPMKISNDIGYKINMHELIVFGTLAMSNSKMKLRKQFLL